MKEKAKKMLIGLGEVLLDAGATFLASWFLDQLGKRTIKQKRVEPGIAEQTKKSKKQKEGGKTWKQDS